MVILYMKFTNLIIIYKLKFLTELLRKNNYI